MEPRDPQETLFTELLAMGFRNEPIRKALQLTNDSSKAIELILKFQEDEFDLNAKTAMNLPEKIENDWVDEPESGKSQYKLVCLVRSDLKMGVGKIAAQCGHAILGAYKNASQSKILRLKQDLEKWEYQGQAKVILKINSKEEMMDLEEKAKNAGLNTYIVQDAGRTQVEPGSYTVCAMGPSESSQIDQITSHLKLL